MSGEAHGAEAAAAVEQAHPRARLQVCEAGWPSLWRCISLSNLSTAAPRHLQSLDARLRELEQRYASSHTLQGLRTAPLQPEPPRPHPAPAAAPSATAITTQQALAALLPGYDVSSRAGDLGSPQRAAVPQPVSSWSTQRSPPRAAVRQVPLMGLTPPDRFRGRHPVRQPVCHSHESANHTVCPCACAAGTVAGSPCSPCAHTRMCVWTQLVARAWACPGPS
jgi:hypothetical protein